MIGVTMNALLYLNSQPAELIKKACEYSEFAIVIEDGVIVNVVKEIDYER